MSKPKLYTQCKFAQQTEKGSWRFDVAWIPKKFARVGNWIRIDDREGNWRVCEVWGTKPEEELLADERNYMKQRSVSDI
jgi:hypothetical protein